MINRVYIDTNVFIDLLDNTRPFHIGSFNFIRDLIAEGKSIYINSDTLTNAFYVLNKNTNLQNLISIMKKMLVLFIVVPIENKEAIDAFELCQDESCAFKDYEDALQYICAKKVNADLIVTNDKEFIALDIKLKNTI